MEDNVNAVLGKDTTDSKNRTISEYTFATKWKYMLIMDIIRLLSGDFKQMKEHIQQVIADMFADIKTLSKTKLSKLQRKM